MNIHEAHLAIVEHFSKPGAQLGWSSDSFSVDGRPLNRRCQYRGGGNVTSNVRCGVGVLIPDGLYKPEWDLMPTAANGAIGHVLAHEPEIAEFFKDVPNDYLNQVQRCHDSCMRTQVLQGTGAAVGEFLDLLDGIAEEWKIELVPNFPPAVEKESDRVLVAAT